jgi:L-serine dehydratase
VPYLWPVQDESPLNTPGSLFDVMGPIMVGPSSSHTAGAVRLAQLARFIANQPIHHVTFQLYNSFAKTYRGHGTDRGLLAGILGLSVNDERIREAYQFTGSLQYTFQVMPDDSSLPPNTVSIILGLQDGTQQTIVGHSLGGGKVLISRIDEYHVNLRGEYPTLVLFYQDEPGMIWQVTKCIAENKINIATLNCARRAKGSQAFMAICLDALLPESSVAQIKAIQNVYVVHNIDRLPS